MSTFTLAVLGPGGVGGLLAALTARADHRVVCLAGEATAAVLRRDGITVHSRQFGDFTVTVDADTVLREPVDACLVAVKHAALEESLERLPPGALGAGVVVPFLNGVDHMDLLRARYGDERVGTGVIRVESTRTAPGVIEHGSPFTEIDLAGPVDRLAEVLAGAGASVTVVEDGAAALWQKLAFLAPYALLTTRYRATVGEVRTSRQDEMRALVTETVAVARAAGARVTAEGLLSRFEQFPGEAKSSMLRDAEAGRPLELDAIGGAVLRAAQRFDIPVPNATRLVGEIAAAPA